MSNGELMAALRNLTSVIIKEYKLQADAEIKKLKTELENKESEIELLKAELKQAKTCTVVKPANLGYFNSFAPEVYAEMDNMIRLGYSNKAISEKLGIHRNTVSARRSKIKNMK